MPYKKLINISIIPNKEEIKSDSFEIDLLINNFNVKDLQLLCTKYSQHFFFKEQLKLEKIENNKVNVISEICHDLVKTISSKIEQEEKYINIIKIFESLRNEKILDVVEPNKKKIIDSFLINHNNENIFIFITNGSYFILQLAVKIANIIFANENSKNPPKEEDITLR